ncbi:MAG: asparaginase [Longibaculum sp.]
MKTIAIVATGGTIAGTGKQGKTVAYRAGEMNVDEIIQSIPMIKDIAHIKEYQLMNVDSNEMNPQRWIVLANTINEIVKDETIDGVVVTHGTDTLDETAYFLTLTLNTDKPVVITGAMRPATATSADGPYNLYQAVCLATHNDAYHQGVMGLFSNTIYSGRDIQKINNYKVDAFDQKAFGCLGYMQDHEVYFFSRTFKIHTLASLFSKKPLTDLPSVGIAYFYAGASNQLLYDLAKNHHGIILTGSGSGNYSQEWLAAIEDLSHKGIIFVRSSRVAQGIVFEDEIFDPHHCCIPANTLTPQKARVLLMLALNYTKDREEIRKIFNEY